MPTTYHARPAPCSHCGDTVLVVEESMTKLFGYRMQKAPEIRLEHADPSPDGAVFDGVDDECRRAPVQ